MDGVVNVTDVTLIQKVAVSVLTIDDVQTFAADVNGDGEINVVDSTLIQKYSAELETESKTGTYEKYFAA